MIEIISYIVALFLIWSLIILEEGGRFPINERIVVKYWGLNNDDYRKIKYKIKKEKRTKSEEKGI